MANLIILLTEKDINTQEAAKDSKNLNIITDNFIINLDKSAIDELIIDLKSHIDKFGKNW